MVWIPNNWQNQYPEQANQFHDLIVGCMNTHLRVLENYGCEYCLDPEEVNTDFQKSGKHMCIE